MKKSFRFLKNKWVRFALACALVMMIGDFRSTALAEDDGDLPDVTSSEAAASKSDEADSLADLEKAISEDPLETSETKVTPIEKKAARSEEASDVTDLDTAPEKPAKKAVKNLTEEERVEKELDKLQAAKPIETPAKRAVSNEDLRPIQTPSLSQSGSATPVPDDLTLQELAPEPQQVQNSGQTMVSSSPRSPKNSIKTLEFKMQGTASRVVLSFNRKPAYREEHNGALKQHIYYFENMETPQRLQRAYDTTEFPSPVSLFTLLQLPGQGAPLSKLIVQLREDKAPTTTVTPTGMVVEFAAPDVTRKEPRVVLGDEENEAVEENIYANTKTFSGKKIDKLEIKNSDIQDVLRLIAKSSGYNIVIGEDVGGRVGTLSLTNIPWDQAFALVLQSKKLGYIRQGNVLRVGTLAALTQEKNEAMANEQSRIRVEPLRTVLIPISYAKAADLATRAKKFLTDRGSAEVDTRTNTIILRDVDKAVQRVQKLFLALDSQPPTVSITARIVEMTVDYFRAFGFANTSFGFNVGGVSLEPNYTAAGDGGNLVTTLRAPSIANLESIFHLGETENKVKVLANPTVSVIANQAATITQGVTTFITTTEVVAGQGPVTSTRGVPANLTLNVTPIVSGDGSISLTVTVTNDIPRSQGGNFSVDTRNLSTQVLIENGDTVVMGGVFKDSFTTSRAGVPVVSKIPLLGMLFSRSGLTETRSEVFLFLTAKITNAEESFKRNL